MDPKIWGRYLWTSMIHIAQVYPIQPTKTDIQNYGSFFTSIGNVLPCEICRDNYHRHLKNIPINLNSRNDLLHWLHQVHNQTLLAQNRPQITFTEFLNKYNVSPSPYNLKNIIFFTLLILIVLISYYYFYKRGNSPSYLRR